MIKKTPDGNRRRTAGGTGFRLHKLELWNWGTFDGHVFTVKPAGQSTLLIGQNGSGKSTVVDALLTLLVRPGVRNFNVAAGAKKRERDERSYLLGAYDRVSDDDGQGIRIKYLRPKGQQYAVILACFRNEDLGREFTVAQVLYLTSDHSVDKVYCFADDERSILDDFSQLDSTGGMIKVLKGRGLRATRTFQEFEGWFSKAARVKPKAMEVFNQTVAVKDIQRLNDFIRDHMLEPHDWGEKVDQLLGHFTQLSETHDCLVRARLQRDLLEPIAALGAEYRHHAEQLEQASRLVEASAAYFAQRTVDLLVPAVAQKEDELLALAAHKNRSATQIRSQQERVRVLRNEMESVSGDRLKQLPGLIDVERAHAERKRTAYERWRAALAGLNLSARDGDERAFESARRQIPPLLSELDAEIERLGAERDRALVRRGVLQQQLATLRDELEGLRQRQNNIPQWCVQLRTAICGELGISPAELPFAAELMQVQPAAREWEASIEKVLRGLALSLLVPEEHYAAVAGYVDRTRLLAHGRGQRLAYLRVSPVEAPRRTVASRPGSLISKLAFRDGHALLPWLQAELRERFNYACCETVEEFRQHPGLAITRHRHVKAGGHRHEKDDREQATDPRRFVLGWDNRQKKQTLAAEINQLLAAEEKSASEFAALEQQRADVHQQHASALELQRVARFDEIDFAPHEREIELLEEERRALEEGSDQLRVLKRRLRETESEERVLQSKHEQLIGDERDLQRWIGEARRLVAHAESELRRCRADGGLAASRESFAALDEALEQMGARTLLSSDNLLECRERFRVEFDRRISGLQRDVEPLRNRLTESMSRFLRVCPEQTVDLRASVDYLDSFLALRRQILAEDLPRHEQRFKERLNQKVIEELGLFRSSLEQERRRIEDKIELLNGSLRKLDYRPGTHLQLEPRPVRDAEIADFQSCLRECVEDSFSDSAVANESRFERIKELLVRLRDNENRGWRNKVTDVRRWFDFVAAVIDSPSGKSVSVYEDSSGQSGGEKAKLAFTILVAAIAYQYDLDPERPVSDRFQFVVVDEMFSKVDDQHAEYALELFRQFGLQLLIVAPLDAKARVTQPYVGCYLHAVKKDNRSAILEMTAQEFEDYASHEEVESIACEESSGGKVYVGQP